MAKVQVGERTYSSIYIDERFKHKYAISVRHTSSMEVFRFFTEDAAKKWQRALRKQGYTKRKR